MRVRIKFAKKSAVQYLGHLDIMRFFQRSFNRADVKMEYSIGFNPHQKMSFAQPLGVGITSCGEYLDAEIAPGQDLEDICRRLNEVCGDGFDVLSVRALPDDAKKAMAALRYASYKVDVTELEESSCAAESLSQMLTRENGISDSLQTESQETSISDPSQIASQESSFSDPAQTAIQETSISDPSLIATLENAISEPALDTKQQSDFNNVLNRAIKEVLAQKEIPVIKTTKSGSREVDIRPLIVRLSNDQGVLSMTVTAASDNNLKPDTLTREIIAKTGIEYRREKVKIKREELYADDFVPLEKYQTL